MRVIEKGYSRVVQGTMGLAQKFIQFRIPEVKDRLEQIPGILTNQYLEHPLLVVSNSVSRSDRFQQLKDAMWSRGRSFDIYTGIKPDPTFDAIKELASFYEEKQCDAIVAIGGGSVMDAAKAMGILVSHPGKSLKHFRGMQKVSKEIPFFIAVPTTAGTGSEATVAAVVTNPKNGDKFAISDGKLIPNVAILDDSLLENLPQNVIAGSGMDAFTHAIEAYIGTAGTEFTNGYALRAMKLIRENLYDFYLDSHNAIARKNMLKASYYAGIAFTRAYVGYVHALAHAVGGVYHKSHGYSIAVLLPYVLEAYGDTITDKMADVYDAMHLGNLSDNREKSKAVIGWVKETNEKMKIPASFAGMIQSEDLNKLAKHAAKEGNPWYPVPKEMDRQELKEILLKANG